jgi:hypothetical protein
MQCQYFEAQSHIPFNCCVRFAAVVTIHDATLATGRTLLLTWTGLSPAGSRQLAWRHPDPPRRGSAVLRVADPTWVLRTSAARSLPLMIALIPRRAALSDELPQRPGWSCKSHKCASLLDRGRADSWRGLALRGSCQRWSAGRHDRRSRFNIAPISVAELFKRPTCAAQPRGCRRRGASA